MNRNEFQDIIPPNKKTIRNIQNAHTTHMPNTHPSFGGGEQTPENPTTPAKPITPIPNPQNPPNPVDPTPPAQPTQPTKPPSSIQPPPPPTRDPRSSKCALFSVGAVVLVVFALSFSLLIADSRVSVIPKQTKTLVDARFEAVRNAIAGELTYEVMNIEIVASRTVPATGQEEVSLKSSGTIVIYNNYNSSNQRLVKNTRFETPEGLIYRINKSVVVPGQKKVNGKTVPGQVEAVVYADDPGSAYNIGLTDFTIPGFAGDPRFDDFYARSKEAMEGGFVGMQPTVEDGMLEVVRAEIRESLQKELLNEALSQKPERFYLFEDAMFITYESLPYGEISDGAEVKEKGILHGVLFDKELFSGFVAENTLAGFDDEIVEIADITSLTFIIEDKQDVLPLQDEEFFFTLRGNVDIVWQFDEEKLKSDLSGRSKDALATILSGYPGIEQAEVTLRPFWKRAFPDNPEKIRVELVLSK